MNYAHFLYVPFTGLGRHDGFRGDEWLKNRVEIFKRFTLASVMNQMNQDFVLWISWRPEEKENPIVQDFVKSLASIRDLNVVHTFGGLCFYDDRYPDEVERKRLFQHLSDTLPELKEWVQNRTVLMTIQPSDDMYLSTAVGDIQGYFTTHPNMEAVGFQKGYIANYATKEISEYSCEPWKKDETSVYMTNTNPPFYTMKFPPDVFLNPKNHMEYTSLKEDVFHEETGELLYAKGTPCPSHEYVYKCLKMGFFDYRGFVVGTHGVNISTTWTHRYKGRELSKEEQDDILILTGTLFSEPFIVK